MAEDISPVLLEKIQKSFQTAFDRDAQIQAVYQAIEGGTATYAQANEFAVRVGELLAEAFGAHLSSSVLPDGRMYYNIAKSVLSPTFRRNYELITGVTTSVQEALNAAVGLGLKAQIPTFNQDRLDGIINRVSSEESFDDVAWILQEPVVNFSQSIVDDSVRINAEFQAGAGLRPKIVRTLRGKACDWCRALAGTYTYPDVPKDVYRRHENCRCTVVYDPGSGKRQNVHTKQWTTAEERAKIETRKTVGLEPKQRQFQSEALLQHHFEKHAGEFGTISIPEYLQRANTLAERELSDDVVSLLRSDGSTSKYCFSTNEFMVINADGTIRTYFKPEKKEVYWQHELDRN